MLPGSSKKLPITLLNSHDVWVSAHHQKKQLEKYVISTEVETAVENRQISHSNQSASQNSQSSPEMGVTHFKYLKRTSKTKWSPINSKNKTFSIKLSIKQNNPTFFQIE